MLRLRATCPVTILFHLNMHRKSAMLLCFPRNYSFTCFKFFFPSLLLSIKMTSTLGSITAASPAPAFQVYLLRFCAVLLYLHDQPHCLKYLLYWDVHCLIWLISSSAASVIKMPSLYNTWYCDIVTSVLSLPGILCCPLTVLLSLVSSGGKRHISREEASVWLLSIRNLHCLGLTVKLYLEKSGEKIFVDMLRKSLLEEGMATRSSILAWRIPMDREAWRAIVHGVTKSWTWLSN